MLISKNQRILLIVIGTVLLFFGNTISFISSGACFFLSLLPLNSKKKAWEMFNENRETYCEQILYAMMEIKNKKELRQMFEETSLKKESNFIKATILVSGINKKFKFIIKQLSEFSEFEKSLKEGMMDLLNHLIKGNKKKTMKKKS